jgi:hypothetical protein
MNTLKMMFGGGTDIASLAEKIRQFGRGEDKILAHITPEEAAMLKEQGGSGTVNPMTGLPEFQRDYGELLASESDYRAMQSPQTDYRAEMLAAEPVGYYGTSQTGYNQAGERTDAGLPLTQRQQYDLDFRGGAPMFEYTGNVGGLADRVFPYTRAGREASDIGFGPGQFTAPVSPAQIAGASQAELESRYPSAFEDENIFSRAENRLQELGRTLDRDYPTLTRIGGAGASLLGQALLQRRAGREREAEAARLRERAQPFRAAETEALERARGGGLTPMQAREMQRQMGQARQGLSAANRATGSAAAGILAGQEQRSRSVARQESLQSALDLAGIADRYERQAIQEELAKDQELANLFAQVVGREIEAATRTQAPQQAPQRRA